jgi:ubiquitin-protein ligase
MTSNSKIEEEINEFNEWKNTISCSGNYSTSDSTLYVTMDGPINSPYVGGKFKISIYFPNNFPTGKPTFKFLTPICHINICGESICLDSINYYNPDSTSIVDILTQIFLMLTTPNDTSIYNSTYGELYKNDLDAYFEKAREMTSQYAK